MASIEDLGIYWVIHSVTRRGDTTYLIEHLRRDGKITPELKTLISDVLEGKIKAKPKRKKINDIFNRGSLESLIDTYRFILRGESDIEWKRIDSWLTDADYKGKRPPESKGEITKAAKALTCQMLNITESQLSEILEPRTVRKKTR
jgi:hypothetical protein